MQQKLPYKMKQELIHHLSAKKKIYLANLKSGVDKLDIAKSKNYQLI